MSHLVLIPFKPHLRTLYKGLVDAGCQITGLAHQQWIDEHDFGEVAAEPITIMVGYPMMLYKYIKIPWQAPRYIWRFAQKIHRLQPDVLVVFDAYHWYFLQALRIKKRNPEITLVLYSETKRWPRRGVSAVLMRWFLGRLHRRQSLVDAVLVYTPEGQDFLQQYISAEKIHIVPAPIDTNLFRPPVSRAPGHAAGPLRILMNARFDAYKNHSDLLAAVQTLRAAGKSLTLTLIGRADDGKQRVQKMVDAYGLTDVVQWQSPVAQTAMPGIYWQHDVLVLPSYNEAIGLVVPEAMACGVATITSDTVGANVYVKPGETGLVFETGNVPELTSALLQYVDQRSLAGQHGAAGTVHVSERFSVSAISRQVLVQVAGAAQKTHKTTGRRTLK